MGVIGIVIVAAIIIVFLSDLFISIVDGTNGIFFKRNKKSSDRYDDEDDRPVKRPVLLNSPKEEVKTEEVVSTKVENNVVENHEVVNKKTVDTTKTVNESSTYEEHDVDLKKAQEEEELAKRNATRADMVGDRKNNQENIIVTPAPEPAKAPEPKQNDEDIDKLIAEISRETIEEMQKQTEEDKIKEENEKLVAEQQKQKEENEKLADKQMALQAEIEKLKLQIEDDKNTISELEDKIKNTPEAKTEIKEVKVAMGNKEQIESRLAILRQRLKENERELNANKKEYNPLKRVNATLESDKKKLRRKEAIVAKQKVVLYGVNNYVDIDEEKAKKLSEELDLLEGLRLSVQHCEEVMQKNKDRYPILERANKFLVKSNFELKDDIKTLENELKEIEENEKKNKDAEVEIDTDDEE